MVGNENGRVKIPDSTVSAGEQIADSVHVPLPAEKAVGFIAHLHHTNLPSCIRYGFQNPCGVFVYFTLQGFMVMLLPVFRPCLLFRISPEIRILNIHQQLHAVPGSTLPDFRRCVQIAVAASVAVSVLIIGLVPDPDSDVIDPIFRQRPENVLFPVVCIVKGHASFLNSQNGRDINASDRLSVIDGHIKIAEYNLRIRCIRLCLDIQIPAAAHRHRYGQHDSR